jgi:glycosyltransferase involved in cell wall biosynthesis
MTAELSVVMTLAFYPRGGSAQVARYLAAALGQCGTDVTLCSGSLGPQDSETNARTFFAGLNTETVDFTAALEAFLEGRDPMAVEVPIHPSFEDRPDVPDRIFADLDDDEYQRQVAPWSDLLGRIEAPDVYHVHHLTHVNEAVRVHDEVPVLVHLHGTELKMLGAIRDGGTSSWAHARAWSERLIMAARRADRLISISPADCDLAVDLLGVSPEVIDIVPNGVDLTRFSVEPLGFADRMARWMEWLVDEPRGWDESGAVGSVSYTHDQVTDAFTHPESGEALPVFLFVGRFLDFKRVPLLIRAYARAREALGAAAPPLVIWGGHPGEWEGEHPHSVAVELGVDGVFFAGWRGHQDLSVALNCADVLVAPSVDEPFGQVYLEAMASGLAVIGTRSGGPPSFVNTDPDRPDGWLVEPDSEAALAEALIAAAGNMADTRARGRNGRSVIERDFDWLQIADRVAQIYAGLAAAR